MKNTILASAIAGCGAGIIGAICSYLFILVFRIFEPIGGFEIWDFSLSMLYTLAQISLGMIWGIIFGIIYSRFYDSIPGKEVLKGVYFGLLIWVVKDVAAGSYTILIRMDVSWGIGLILIGFFMWIVYGPVLGYLYKK
jgi:hypothetical protein